MLCLSSFLISYANDQLLSSSTIRFNLNWMLLFGFALNWKQQKWKKKNEEEKKNKMYQQTANTHPLKCFHIKHSHSLQIDNWLLISDRSSPFIVWIASNLWGRTLCIYHIPPLPPPLSPVFVYSFVRKVLCINVFNNAHFSLFFDSFVALLTLHNNETVLPCTVCWRKPLTSTLFGRTACGQVSNERFNIKFGKYREKWN